VHANGVAEVPARLEALAALGGLSREAASAQITAALHTVIHVERGEPVGVHRPATTLMTGIEGHEEISQFRPSHLSKDDPVGPHSQGFGCFGWVISGGGIGSDHRSPSHRHSCGEGREGTTGGGDWGRRAGTSATPLACTVPQPPS
jgi:hypothetical protein